LAHTPWCRETLYPQHMQRFSFCSKVNGCFDGIQAGLTEQFVFKACCINKSWLENWYPNMSPSSHLKLQLCCSFLQLYTQYTISSPVISVHCGVSDTKGLDINSFATLKACRHFCFHWKFCGECIQSYGDETF